MFEEANKLCQEISVLKRLCFAAKYLNKETPKYWDFVKAFGFMSMDIKPDSRQVEIFMQNLQYLDSDAMEVDQSLLQGFKDIHLELFYYRQTIHASCVEEIYLCELIDQASL